MYMHARLLVGMMNEVWNYDGNKWNYTSSETLFCVVAEAYV